MNQIPREVLRTDDFIWLFEQIEADVQRADAMWRGIEWALARTPLRGDVIVRAALSANGPNVVITAFITDELATAHHIEKTD